MKKTATLLALVLITASVSCAQKYFTRSGYIHFFSTTNVEDISADNNKATVVLDAGTGAVEISCLIKAFEFEKALMQEHFNENYMESDTYPKSVFKGKVENIKAVNFFRDGTYSSQVSGEIFIHGVTKTIFANVTFVVSGGKIETNTNFSVNPKDYNITIPDLVKNNISENIRITVKSTLEELKK
ncbi:MAG: YceI family protein [Crocinitomicaceae bacterium]|nr:YceI family protein [Crocinitomicaceae bacterium]